MTERVAREIEAEFRERCRRVVEAHDEEVARAASMFRRTEQDARRRKQATIGELEKWRKRALKAAQIPDPVKLPPGTRVITGPSVRIVSVGRTEGHA